ncbi:MAG TPA: glycosyltransferase family 4 protein [Herpetosiphonaceae bacterium]|nr:glycosyltransferase family 4 protein [Herpetosiphonaceae bacterium]
MRRIAYCSPVNPLPTGISDYSEELLPFLGQYAEIVLFVPSGTQPTNQNLRRLEVHPVDLLPRRHAARPFDAIVYHLGNSPVHAEIYEAAQRLPGVVVLHEWVLHHFKLWYAATRRGDVEQYMRELAQRYGERGTSVGQRMARGQLLDAAFEMPLVEDVVERAAGIVVHSRWMHDRVKALRPDVAAAVVPMGVPLPMEIRREDARRRLNLPAGVPIWASFGHINPYKRMEAAMRAFRRFRAVEPRARYLLVGSLSPSYDLPGLIRRLGLGDSVHILGHLSSEDFALYLAASDICLNLRYPTAGETSASSLRLLAAGRPTLVSDVGALAEFPDDVAGKVAIGPGEEQHIFALARLVHLWPEFAARWGDSARRYVAARHTLPEAAHRYILFLAALYGWSPPTRQRPTLWDLLVFRAPMPASSLPEDAREGERQKVVRDDQPGAGSPAATIEPQGLLHQLAEDAGRALAELAVQPDDASVLEDVATTLAGLWSEPVPRDLERAG